MLVEIGKNVLIGDELKEIELNGKKITAIQLHSDAVNINYGMAKTRKQAAIMADSLVFFPYNGYHFYESDLGCERVCKLSEFEEQIELPKTFDKHRTYLFIY